jgi:probable rRNA maturation factor
MEIVFGAERRPGDSVVDKMIEAAKVCCKNQGIEEDRVEVSVTFVSMEEMKILNNTYRGIDQVTDVLSFPQYGELGEMPAFGNLCLGDVVICTDQALLQAHEFGHSPEREIVYLFVHSLAHLLGYDHITRGDQEIMRAVEEEIMESIDLARI